MHDKKSDHYTSPANYRDLDGNMRTFTYVDHDPKSKISTNVLSQEEKDSLDKVVKQEISNTIDEILALPAVSLLTSGNGFAEDYIERNVENGKIAWRAEMVRNALTINHTLRQSIRTMIWKSTVKEQYWYEDMAYNDIIEGKWKEWV